MLSARAPGALRLRNEDSGYTEDVSVVCGPLVRAARDPLALTNPVRLVEVTSPSTEDYDRGDKLSQSRSPSTSTPFTRRSTGCKGLRRRPLPMESRGVVTVEDKERMSDEACGAAHDRGRGLGRRRVRFVARDHRFPPLAHDLVGVHAPAGGPLRGLCGGGARST